MVKILSIFVAFLENMNFTDGIDLNVVGFWLNECLVVIFWPNMFLVILILSQIFDWNNFWRSTIFSCGKFMVRAVIDVVETDGVDLT